jgi:hypothetical protein
MPGARWGIAGAVLLLIVANVGAAVLSTAGAAQAVVADATAIGGRRLGHIAAGDWAAYNNINVGGGRSLRARVSSGGNGGTLQVRTGSQSGPVLGSLAVQNTGGWNSYVTITTPLSGVPTGTSDVYLTFAGAGSLFDVDQFIVVKS